MNDDDLEALLALEMKKLQDHFLSEIPNRKAALEQCWSEVMAGGPLEELRQQVHSLRGTGSTLGFVRLGEIATPLEHALKEDASRDSLGGLYANLLEELSSPETPKSLV
jgi:HPt (histidine-containing phosphotransfer) domain-containing protein